MNLPKSFLICSTGFALYTMSALWFINIVCGKRASLFSIEQVSKGQCLLNAIAVHSNEKLLGYVATNGSFLWNLERVPIVTSILYSMTSWHIFLIFLKWIAGFGFLARDGYCWGTSFLKNPLWSFASRCLLRQIYFYHCEIRIMSIAIIFNRLHCTRGNYKYILSGHTIRECSLHS